MLTSLDVESRTGCLFCQMCDDFVWDPTLEDLRLRKFGTGTFSSKHGLPSYLYLCTLGMMALMVFSQFESENTMNSSQMSSRKTRASFRQTLWRHHVEPVVFGGFTTWELPAT